MGQCCSTGPRPKPPPGTTRPDRSLAELLAQERAMVMKTIAHLRNIVPGLLVHVVRDKFPENDICEGNENEHEDKVTEELLQTTLNTIRHTIISYSKAYSGDSTWFKLALTNKEALVIVNSSIKEKKMPLESSKLFTTEQHKELARSFISYFQEKYATLDEPKTQAQVLSGVYWRDAAELCNFFMQADADAGGDLDVDEIQKIMHKRNVGIDGSRLRHLIKKEDTSQDGRLDFAEYISFFLKITEKRFIQQVLFNEYVKTQPRQIMGTQEFHTFLAESQGYTGSLSDTKLLVLKLKELGMAISFKSANGTDQIGLSPRHFAHYLTSFPSTFEEEKDWEMRDIPHNSCYDPKYTTRVYQDMNQPMTDYFIASSHNTYLEEGQLRGPSSANAYKNALLLGCRCVEIDCWDGDDGEPIVYHGYTLTTRVTFIEVIKTINEYAFAASPYPVILSLEVHCSAPQQHRMGVIMKQIFRRKNPDGTMYSILQPPIAYTDHERTSPDFTPEGLKGQILVKGKILGRDDGLDLFNEHLRLVRDMTEELEKQGKKHLHVDETKGADDKCEDEREVATEVLEKRKSSDAKDERLSPELSSCVWMKSVHFRGYEQTKVKGHHWDVSSFTEGSMQKLSSTERENFAHVNKLVFSRIYPAGTRINSDNYFPQEAWNMGCQIVALNYQLEYNKCQELRYNLGKFLDNGKCGYLLKPAPLRDPAKRIADFRDKRTIVVEVLQGLRLPKPDSESEGEKIDPYVQVSLCGVDTTSRPKGIRTKTVDDNGWNPEFFTLVQGKERRQLDRRHIKGQPANTEGGNLFRFTAQSLELAVLTIQVWDSDATTDDFIGEAVIPVRCLRQGYRAVPLRSATFEHLDALLFCRFKLSS